MFNLVIRVCFKKLLEIFLSASFVPVMPPEYYEWVISFNSYNKALGKCHYYLPHLTEEVIGSSCGQVT